MAVTSEYYSVSINTSPFEIRGMKEVGSYSTKNTAESVASFIRLAFEQKVPEGINIEIHSHKDKMIKTSLGLRPQKTLNGSIILIQETLSKTEIERLLKLLPILLRSKIIQPNISISKIDSPKRICEGNYYCVTLDFLPFDKSHKLFVGYYQSKQTAECVLNYIKQVHCHEKIGFGFDMNLETYKGKFVKYDSGKLYLKIREINHEIVSSCDSNEFIRISKAVNQAIDKWSGV